ncbi:EVE domain-containing protein [Acinetobacter baumannii]
MARIKDDPKLNHLPLIRQSRLSVMPIDDAAWKYICKLGGG